MTALMIACDARRNDIVKLLLRNEALVTLQDNTGKTALMIASSLGGSDNVELLLKIGDNQALVNVQDNKGQTALMMAQEPNVNSIIITRMLLEHGAMLNLQDGEGITALMIACQKQNVANVRFLLQNGAQTTLTNKAGQTALIMVSHISEKKVADIIKLLLDTASHYLLHIQDNDGNTALMIACSHGAKDNVRQLLNSKDNNKRVNMKDNEGKTALMKAQESDQSVEIAKLLINHGAVVDLQDKNKRTALMAACSHGKKENVEFLLSNGANVNMQDNEGKTVLMRTQESEYDNTAITKLLIDHGAVVDLQDKNERTALMAACRHRSKDNVEFLLGNGANVNMQDSEGRTALMKAQESVSTTSEIAKLLINHGAVVDLQDKNGQTALMRACGCGRIENVEFLLKCEVNQVYVNMQDNKGKTALMITQESGYDKTDIAELLINYGANVNLQDEKGNTALIIACQERNPNAVYIEFLLKNESQAALQNNEGKTALMGLLSNVVTPSKLIQLVVNSNPENQVNLQDNEGNTALTMACKTRNNKTVQFLLKSGAKVNMSDKWGHSALTIACENGYADTAKLLLDAGALVDSLDNTGQSALMKACKMGHIKCLELLLKFEAQVNLQDSTGLSALALALKCCNGAKLSDIAELLYKNGANINLLNEEQRLSLILNMDIQESDEITLNIACESGDINTEIQESDEITLNIACESGDIDTAQLLLGDGKQNIDFQDSKGRSPLIAASDGGQTILTDMLLKKGASLDLQDNSGRTALLAACEKECIETISHLLDESPDTYLKNNKGKTAYDIAVNSSNKNMLPPFTKLRHRPLYPEIIFLEGAKRERVHTVEKTINLEEVGILLQIPKDALPDTDPPLELEIQPCFSGPFDVPQNIDLVSPAYIVKPNREIFFTNKVLVKIWHHANLETKEDCDDMVFLSASTTPEYRGDNPVYIFKEIKGAKGVFRPGEEQPVGEIALKHFCTLALGKRKRQSDDENESGEIEPKRSKGNLYSARLYKFTGRKIVFCICLCQPQYIRNCDRVISRKYEGNFVPKTLNGVKIEDEVLLKISTDTQDWKTCFDRTPPSISEGDIIFHETYEIEDLLDMDYPPRIEIMIRNSPDTADAEPLILHVEGLSRAHAFTILPEDFLSSKIDTSKIKCAMEELGREINHCKVQSQKCGEKESNLLSIAAIMLHLMKQVEERLQNQVTASIVAPILDELEIRSQQLNQSAGNLGINEDVHSLKVYVEAVGSFVVQLRIIYAGNIQYSLTNPHEWEVATSLFIVNAANLMTAIKNVLLASKHYHRAPSHQPHVATHQPHHCSTSDLRVTDHRQLPISATASTSLLNLPTSRTPLMASHSNFVPGHYSTVSQLQSTVQLPQATVPLHPPQATVPLQPPQATVPLQPPQATVPPQPPQVTVPLQPPQATVPLQPPQVTVPLQPPQVTVPLQPPQVTLPLSSQATVPPQATLPLSPLATVPLQLPQATLPLSSQATVPPQATLPLSSQATVPPQATLPLSPLATVPLQPPQATVPLQSPQATVPLQSPHIMPTSSAASIMVHSPSSTTGQDIVTNQPAPLASLPPYSTLWNAMVDTGAHAPPSTSVHLSAPFTNASGVSPEQHPQPLNKDHTGEVLRCLYPLRAKWKTIGTFLCVDHNSLDVIKKDNEDSDDRLTALIAVWLRRHTPPPTWQALADAVQYIDPDKAQEIRHNVT